MTTGREETPRGGAFWEWVRKDYSSAEVEELTRDPERMAEFRNYYNKVVAPQFPRPETPSQETLRKFREWMPSWYSPEEIVIVEDDTAQFNKIFGYYQGNIQGTQSDVDYVPPETLPAGRPQAERYGLTDTDWKTLSVIGSPQQLRTQLDKLLDLGYINEFQDRDIWQELATQRQRGILELGYTRPEEPYREVPYVTDVVQQPRIPLDYGAGYEEARIGLAETIPQTERWRDWFSSKYPETVAGYQSKTPEAERTQTGWAGYLKKKSPELRERYYGLSEYERGERPSVQAPRIQTVGY